MAHIVVVFGTNEGQSAKVARRVVDVLRAGRHTVQLIDTRDPVHSQPFDGAEAVVLVGSVHMGKFQRALVQFVRTQRQAVGALPSAFLAVSLSAARDSAAAKREVKKTIDGFIRETGVTPDQLVPVAGALVYTRYPFFTRQLMRFISKLAGGDTDASRDYEYTDWAAVSAFAAGFGRKLEAPAKYPAQQASAAL